MNTQYKVLLCLVGKALFGGSTDVQATDAIIEEARQQAVSNLIKTDNRILANNIRVIKAHADMTNILSGIPFVTLKGYASAYYYLDPIGRTMGDVDFYVAPENYDKAKERLLESGFRLSAAEHERHETYLKDKIHFELHSEIKGIPNGRDGITTTAEGMEQVVRHYLDDVIETAVSVRTQHGTILIPDAFHHGLIMLLHVAGHMINDGGVGLRHLCDWAVYVDRTDFGAYKRQFTEMGLWTFACQLTAVSSRYLGLNEKTWAGKWNEAHLEALMDDIMSAGNFGRKENGRGVSLKLNQGKGLTPITQMTKKRYDFCDRWPILLPFGYVAYSCSFLWKRITGQKEWISLDTLQNGKHRKELYDSFRLFE